MPKENAKHFNQFSLFNHKQLGNLKKENIFYCIASRCVDVLSTYIVNENEFISGNYLVSK